VHCEEVTAPGTGDRFEVELAASGKTISVGPTQSLLEAMEAAGVDAPYLCRGGACGQCETNVIRCDGHIDHRDHWLSSDEMASNTKIMPCVSRFTGKALVIDR
jgi:ferredoxin